ncbi:MAG: hypothetical protein FWH10_07330, partial [Oscillospiraceae bacterium]|nr:hypothetical protein [Oscillospiraceae bacterium]
MRIKILYAVIIILSVFFLKSCGSSDIYDYDFDSGDPGEILSNILASYRKNGMTSWWDILAVYNAGENPMDYKGFGDVLNSLDGGETNIKAASYVIAANAALAIGADEAHFENYGEYKSKLKDFLEENPADNNYTINDYIFAYLALFTSGENFSFRQAISYLSGLQKSDGGFSLSGNSGDIDITAYTFQVLDIAGEREPFEWTVEFTDAIFNFFGNNIRENGTFVEFWGKTENANSTAAALSAFIKLGGKNEITSEK